MTNTPSPDEDRELIEERFWHDCADVPDLDTSRHAVRRAINYTLESLLSDRAKLERQVQELLTRYPLQQTKFNAS